MILLCGFQKTGNTWVRFVIFNYFNILHNDSKKTLTYKELQQINRHRLNTNWDFDEGFPPVVHTHHAADGQAIFKKEPEISEKFRKFHTIIYLYRNPYDTMISYYHFMMDRDAPWNGAITGEELENIRTLDGFARKFIHYYRHHHEVTTRIADYVWDYDHALIDPFDCFYDVISLINGEVDEDILTESITLSSFENIRKMGIEMNQIYGLAPEYRGHFTRDGRSGQYEDVMNKETIKYIKEVFFNGKM